MSASLDPRPPVLIGAGQLNQRVDRGDPRLEPVDLMAEALRRAAADTGGAGVARRAPTRSACVSVLSWRYRDPGALVAERLGAVAAEHGLHGRWAATTSQIAWSTRPPLDIQDGRADLVLLSRRRGVAHPHRQPASRRPTSTGPCSRRRRPGRDAVRRRRRD